MNVSSPKMTDLGITTASVKSFSMASNDTTTTTTAAPDMYDAYNFSDDNLDFWEMENPEEMLRPWVINEYFIPTVITHSVTFLIGVIGNLVVVFVMAGDRKSRTATNMFLVSLSLADLLLLSVCAPLENLELFVIQWDVGGTVCKMAAYFGILSAMASVLNLTAVSLERYIVIVYPMRSRSLCTMSNCKKAVIVVWSVALVLAAPVVITKEIHPARFGNNVTIVTIHYCKNKETMGLWLSIYQLLVLLILPAMLMIFFYSRVISELWKSTKTMKQMTGARSSLIAKPNSRKATTSSSSPVATMESTRVYCGRKNVSSNQSKGEDVMKTRKQVIKMLLLVIALFLICWGPRLIMDVILKVGLETYSRESYAMRIAFFLMPFIHACINPFVYCFMSKNFQRSMRRQLQRMGIACPAAAEPIPPPVRTGAPTGADSTRHTYCPPESVL
ncbi:cholecystokinin receptor type A-like [Amphibalanus amphitrite]|uniref:cholecystokinin receptor type A-like n=1 Tax=Amphibalanus amphitrite TaxID=1232801 RepID=UPI001C9227B1|nr:cholecystokinin receptor type A-like [Amphibalanus amphitrite]